MRRFAQPRSSLLVSRICRPSASRPYATKGKNADTTTTTSQTEVESSDLDAKNVSGSNLGFDDWSEVNTRDKTIKTAAGQLPISPLLDPAWREARQRKQKKLTQAEATHNRFQRKLMDNVFAQCLAEPVRYCHITRTRVPRPFLQSFGLVKHPETNELWWIPGDFEQNPGEPATEAPDENESSAADDQLDFTEPGPVVEPQENATIESVDVTAENPQSSPDATLEAKLASEPTAIEGDTVAAVDSVQSYQEPPMKTKGKFFAPAHMIARQDLMLEFLDKKSRFSSGYMRFAANPKLGKFCKAAIWRQDMHEVVRDQLRRQIASELVYLWGLCEEKEKGRDYLIKAKNLREFGKDWNRFCCLYPEEGRREPFEIVKVPGTAAIAVPGYDLPTLLGPDILASLKSEASVFQDASLVVLKGRRTLGLNRKLWRLQGFVADYNKLL